MINSNSLLDNYLWAYLFHLCLFFLAYYIFHRVNYQKHKRHKFRLFNPGPKSLPLGEENLQEILLIDFQMSSTMTTTQTLDLYMPSRPFHCFFNESLSWSFFPAPSCTGLHYSAPSLESSVSNLQFLLYLRSFLASSYLTFIPKTVVHNPLYATLIACLLNTV